MSVTSHELTCVSVIVCDDVFRDAESGKLVIVGTFSEIRARALPAKHPKLCVLASITNGSGSFELSVAIEHEETGNEIIRVQGPMQSPSKLAVIEIDIRLTDVHFADEGKYWVKVESGGVILGQRPFQVRLMNQDTIS